MSSDSEIMRSSSRSILVLSLILILTAFLNGFLKNRVNVRPRPFADPNGSFLYTRPSSKSLQALIQLMRLDHLTALLDERTYLQSLAGRDLTRSKLSWRPDQTYASDLLWFCIDNFPNLRETSVAPKARFMSVVSKRGSPWRAS